jgi:hypothetical protein
MAHANHIVVCKTNDPTNPVPAGSMFSFTITNVPSGYNSGVPPVVVNGTSATFSLTVGGTCQDLPEIGAGAHVITETLPSGDLVTNITVDPSDRLDAGTLNLTLGTVSVEAVDTLNAPPTTVTFTDAVPPPPPPTGNQGCTPGYWKQSQHFDSWVGLSPTDLVSSVFTGVAPSLAGETLLAALQGGGGPGLVGSEKILLRAAVAALLDANSVMYPFAYGDIVAAVDLVLAGGSTSDILALATILDNANNGQGGCPLN